MAEKMRNIEPGNIGQIADVQAIYTHSEGKLHYFTVGEKQYKVTVLEHHGQFVDPDTKNPIEVEFHGMNDILYIVDHSGNVSIEELFKTTPKQYVTRVGMGNYETRYRKKDGREIGADRYRGSEVISREEYVTRVNEHLQSSSNRLEVRIKKLEENIKELRNTQDAYKNDMIK